MGEEWNTLNDYIYPSSGLVAETFNLRGRGFLKEGYAADIVIIDPDTFSSMADFRNPERISECVEYLFVNGSLAIHEGKATEN